MLVRFLSFVASVLGSARHRAVIISCAIVVLAIGSVVGVFINYNSDTSDAASTARKESSQDDEQDSLWLQGGQQDHKKTQQEQPSTEDGQDQKQQTSKSTDTANDTSQDTASAVPDPELQLTQDDITLATGESVRVTASVANDADTAWSITAIIDDNELANTIDIETNKQTATTLSFTIHTNTNASLGTYQITVLAQSSGDGAARLTKTLAVTITSAQ